MAKPYKFGWFPDGATDVPYEPPNSWAIETTTGADRLAIAPQSDQVRLLIALAKRMPEPFFVLYVLVLSRTDDEPGRYQLDASLDRSQLNTLLSGYASFLENDGRHNLWIRSEDGSMLIYDRHNVIYAYGALDAFIQTLNDSSLTQSSKIGCPDPHSHHYNAEFDANQTNLVNTRRWIRSPLRVSDENDG